jgi:hypothetical protein
MLVEWRVVCNIGPGSSKEYYNGKIIMIRDTSVTRSWSPLIIMGEFIRILLFKNPRGFSPFNECMLLSTSNVSKTLHNIRTCSRRFDYGLGPDNYCTRVLSKIKKRTIFNNEELKLSCCSSNRSVIIYAPMSANTGQYPVSRKTITRVFLCILPRGPNHEKQIIL